jgi:RNA polymerase sigma-70 factor (ECF subfamily)
VGAANTDAARLLEQDERGMDALSDTELMLLVKEGDFRAFDVLYARYRGPVSRFLFALTWDAQAAEDGLQEVFVGLFKARADYVPSAKLSTYLFRIARNYYLALRRKRRNLQEISLSCPDKDGADPFAGIRANERVEPEIRLMQAYRRWRVRQAIQSLPESQQLVFVMAHFEDMKYAEIAEVLNIPVGTVKSRMFAAVRSLQARLKEEIS